MIDGILEFTYHPVPKKAQGYGLFFASLLVAAAFVFHSVTALRFKGLISLVAVIFMCLGVYVFSRYIGCAYAYAVVYDSDGVPNIIVTKAIGKRLTTLANFPLHSVERIVREDEDKPLGGTKYPTCNFAVSPFPKGCYSLYVSSGQTKARLLLECTEEVAHRLSEYASLAKAHGAFLNDQID